MSVEHWRLTLALLLSLLIHTLLLSLTFGGQGLWFPGFGFPWQERRIEAPDLRVVVVPAQVTPVAEPSQQAWVEQSVTSGPAPTPSVSRAPTPRRTAAAMTPESKPGTNAATDAASAQMPLRADRPGDATPPPIPAPAVIAVTRTDESAWVVPAIPTPPTPGIAAAPSASGLEAATPSLRDAGDEAQMRIDQEARQDAARQAAVRTENATLEAERQEAARQAAVLQEAARQVAVRQEAALLDAARVEAARVEAARVEAARVEAARVEAARVEAARVEAARVEAARVEAARVEAARVEAARVEAARVEAARQATDLQEAARQQAALLESARVDAAQEAAARREAALRAIGRQLDEEAARRDAATAAARLPPSSSSARRYRLFGRTDPNAELILYVEAWSRKIQLNMTFDMVREAAKKPHTDPVVTVAVRSDGSVESVTFVQSSGVAALDDAIRRVVHSQTPYQVFPPALVREFDVIEIRRTWYFDVAIRLY